MITKISLKNIATFDETGIQIDDLKKINFVYGANGSGKTVISNFLANFENDGFSECSASWEHEIPLKTLVYNKKFRDHNFGTDSIAGVFTLGKATGDEIKDIETKQAELTKLKEEGVRKKETLDRQIKKKEEETNNFQDTVWQSAYKKNAQNFKEAFKGCIRRKESFKDELLSQFKNNTSDLLSLNELIEKAKTIFGEAPKTITPFTSISFDKLIKFENKETWTKKIIGKADVNIAQLIQKLNLNDWVNKGREYLQEDKTCPFCQKQTITDEFKKQLEDYFDESFTADIKTIKQYRDDYNLLAENLINELTLVETNEKDNKETKLDINIFSANLKTLSSQFISNKNLLNDKIKEPSRSIELVSTQAQLTNIEKIINKANEQITAHNNIVKNYNTEKKQLIQSVWKYILEENKISIKKFNRTIDGLTTGIDNLTTELNEKRTAYSTLKNKIKTLTQNVTSVQPSVDSINDILKQFGFFNFEIVPLESKPNHYQIQRENGELAEATLSEGEITFITFLYFLQLAKGSINKDTITEERVLIIDDPISSLDSTVLFIVSTILKEIIKDIKKPKGNIKQIILLTHNVYFHKEVSFIDGRTKENKDTYYWILRKNNKVSSIQCFEKKNPIKTSYELLWKELKEHGQNSGITTQNVMRRIIENYFKILGKYGDDKLIEKFEGEEKTICRSLLCWINDGSHGVSDDFFIELSENINDKYFYVFKNIFLKTGHQGHYDMMMADNDDQNH